MKNKLFFVLILFSTISIQIIYSQKFSPPLKLRPALSANFGELRNNHFHAGLDYKTNRSSNKPVYAVADGYVSRISVSPTGYGLALYIDHPDGYTSVYAHMNKIKKSIALYARKRQYELESYKVNLFPKKNELKIKQGEIIGLSGNTGSSGGPHLHFELRDTKSEEPIDPMHFLGRTFHDTSPPFIKSLAFYPQINEGVVNGSSRPMYKPVGQKKSVYAWGKIGVGLKAYDRMNNVKNIYGVKKIQLYVDNKLVYSSNMNRFSYDRTRMLNIFIDFKQWRLNKSFYMKSFIEPGNHLQMYDSLDNKRGIIDINQVRTYRLKYVLKDHFNNTKIYNFNIVGKRQGIPRTNCSNIMRWNEENKYSNDDFSITIHLGNLYSDICFHHKKYLPKQMYFSPIHKVNSTPVPLHKNAIIWIRFDNSPNKNREQYGIVEFDSKGRKKWLGGTFKNNGIEVKIRELGKRYTIDVDRVKPTISPFKPELWLKNRKIQIVLKDNKSGIKHFRGTIDGQFVLFKHDTKSKIYTYHFDERLNKGKNHTLIFEATDNANNSHKYSYKFRY